MTHDERIELMARVMRAADMQPRKFDAHWNVRHFDEQHDEAKQWWYRMATVALAAAGVEEMVRAAAFDGFVQGQGFDGFDNRVGTAATIDDIVREAMGK